MSSVNLLRKQNYIPPWWKRVKKTKVTYVGRRLSMFWTKEGLRALRREVPCSSPTSVRAKQAYLLTSSSLCVARSERASRQGANLRKGAGEGTTRHRFRSINATVCRHFTDVSSSTLSEKFHNVSATFSHLICVQAFCSRRDRILQHGTTNGYILQ